MWEININTYCKKLYSILYRICFDPIGTHKKTRATIGFIFGLSLSILLYITIIINLEFKPYITITLGFIVCIMMSIGCASSIQVRCVCLLTIPAFLGRAGRSLLKALVIGYIITGPIFNLTHNSKEVVRTFVCTAQLTYNLTKTRFDLLSGPFQQAITNMKTNTNDLKNTLGSVQDIMAPIVEEIEGKNEMKKFNEDYEYLDNTQNNITNGTIPRKNKKNQVVDGNTAGEVYEMKYREKIEARCKNQLHQGSQRCRDMFNNTYNKCYDSVTWFAAWLLCWPMKLTFICNIAQAFGGSNICNPSDKIDSGIGNGYASLKDARNKLSGELNDPQIQYKLNIAPSILNVHDGRETIKAVIHEFDVRRELFDTFMTLVKRCLALIFLRVIRSAQQYHDNYLTDIEHDNHYITGYFYKIDARRRARGSMVILPLKKIERIVLIDLYSGIPTKLEKRYIIRRTIKLVFEMITAMTIIFLDILLFETLNFVKKYGYIEYTQVGNHNVDLNIRGTGIMATLIKNIIGGFNTKKEVKMIISNSECLPQPKKLSHHVIIKICSTYFAIWLMLILSSYTQRLQREICKFFYYKREKRRILYLYNETLKRRLNFIRFMRNKVKVLARERTLERDMNPWLYLTINSPYWFGWLRYFEFSRLNCLTCGETEPRKNSNFYICPTPECYAIYCLECWNDMNKICLACTNLSQSDTESNSDYNDYNIQSIGV